MANGIVTPPDYRAANAITGFTDGVKGGLGIVKDVQGIKQNKYDSERKKVTDAQADEDRTQGQKDTHVQRIPDYLRSTVAAAYAGKDTEAADILNMVFVPDPKTGVAPVKALRVTKIQAEDGTPTIEVEYEGGKIVQVDPRVARNWANGMRNETPSMGGELTQRDELRAAQSAFDAATSRVDTLRKEAGSVPSPAQKQAIAEAESERDDLGQQLEDLSGVRVRSKKKASATGKPPRGDPSTLAPAAPGSMTEQERARKGYGITAAGPASATPAPVATTGPAASVAPAIAQPKTQAEFDALPSGAKYINPKDGKTYTKK